MIFAWRTSLRLIPPSADNHQRYQQTENSEPMRGAVITESSHRHSPQRDELAVEGPRARRSMDASTATAKRPPPRQIALRTRFVCARRPHTFTTHVPAPSPGDGSRIFVGLASRLVQMIGTNRKLGDPELTKYVNWPGGLDNRGPRSDSEIPGSDPPQLRCIHPALWATWIVGIDCARALLP